MPLYPYCIPMMFIEIYQSWQQKSSNPHIVLGEKKHVILFPGENHAVFQSASPRGALKTCWEGQPHGALMGQHSIFHLRQEPVFGCCFAGYMF